MVSESALPEKDFILVLTLIGVSSPQLGIELDATKASPSNLEYVFWTLAMEWLIKVWFSWLPFNSLFSTV